MRIKVNKRFLSKSVAIEKGIDLVLEENYWDDYGYKTMFEVYYPRPKTRLPVHIGSISIADLKTAREDKLNGYKAYDDIVKLYGEEFERFNESTVSLGTEEYYKKITEIIKEKEVNFSHKDLMIALNDIAYKPSLLNLHSDEDVINTSFLRGISTGHVTGKLNRLSNGGNETIPYNINLKYYRHSAENVDQTIYEFKTNPESILPTNIHAIIGNNGTGKTRILKDIVKAALKEGEKISSEFSDENNEIKLSLNMGSTQDRFAGLMFMSYSPFDKFNDLLQDSKTESNKIFDYKYIGIFKERKNDEEIEKNDYISFEDWDNKFEEAIKIIRKDRKKHRLFWKQTRYLEFILNKIFKDNNNEKRDWEDIDNLIKEERRHREENETEYNNLINTLHSRLFDAFKLMSSGEKIVTLGVASLVAFVEEKTLVLFDEPELYLHPPLTSNYIRIISEIMNEKNGLAIVVTHSPIILQEIPNNCIYVTDDSIMPNMKRPHSPTFGENISILNHGIFGLDIGKSGFYVYIQDFFEKYLPSNRDKIWELSEMEELGSEARFFLDLLIDSKIDDELEED
ncbi:ATP-binding protein [Aerococcaceae bacterium DSM 111176]|nr:ATP-binding protein [Aerococcaceae bacterium DSM 111176]